MAETQSKVRIPPNSKESEMMVLGCMLTSINALNIAADGLDDADFYYNEHKLIFQVLKSAYKNDKPADVHLICEELKRQDTLDAVGGVTYITTLAQYAGTSAYIEEYAELVRTKSLLRRMINVSQEIEKTALDDPEDVHAVLDEAQQKFFAISQTASPGEGVHLKDILSGVKAASKIPYLKELQERQEAFQKKGPDDPGITGIPTHFIDLDKMINGLGQSNLMILAARPAMGKTAFALNIAENICFKNHLPVGIFSLEMSAEQLVHRVICSQAEVESEKIKTGSLNGSEYQRIVAAVNSMQKHTLIIDDQPGLKITDLRARARRMKEAFGISLLIVDYLQLLSGSGFSRSSENRQNEISEISRMLKTLARELNLPIICLSQLSRKVEERQGHRPMMSDLRESGCLAADTLISDAKTGKRYTIKELAERKVQTPIWVQAVDPKNLKIGKQRMTKVFYSGQKIVFQLKTRSGRTIKASANHPFLKLEGWKRLDELQIGDRIGLPRSVNSEHPSNPLSEQELILLAHLIGDGCVLPNQPYHYTSADEINLELVKHAAKELFQIEGRLVKQKNWYHLYLPSPYHLTHGKYHPITVWFKKMGIERVRSYHKCLPSGIFEHSEEDIALFLRHLWSTDGNISHKKLKGRKPSAAIYYASSSQILAEQVQHLLLKLGIQSTLKFNYPKKYRPMIHVIIQGAPNQLLFLEKVGSAGKRGEIVPILIESLRAIKTNPNCDLIPKEAWNLHIKEMKNDMNLSWRGLFEQFDKSYCGGILLNNISRPRMMEFFNFFKKPALFHLAQSDVYWDEISSITELGVEDVYDATVENVHNFVANDIIVHNSIEQDSDIVMFLLRREYYDPYDKPGLAELIVAKNRHGGVGSVNLSFRKEIAQFANYSPINQASSDNEEAFSAFSPGGHD